MNVNALDTVMITGMGAVGLGGVANDHYRGAKVIAVESQPFRANLAQKLGAITVFDPTDENILDKIMDFPLGASCDMIRKGIVLRGNWHYNQSHARL